MSTHWSASAIKRIVSGFHHKSTKNTTSTAATSAQTTSTTQQQTFHLFPQLPTELQLQIFEYAALQDDVSGIDTWFIMMDALEYSIVATRGYTSRVTGVPFAPLFYTIVKRSVKHGYRTRVALMATCRLARLVSLQAWKKDAKDMGGGEEIREGINYTVQDGGVEYHVVDLEAKTDIVRTVEGLIVDVKGRLERTG